MGLRISRFRSLVRHQSPQLLAGLEHRHRTRGNFDWIAGAWIPRHASLPAANLEGAEAAYLYVVLILKCFLDRVQECVHYSRAIFLGNHGARRARDGGGDLFYEIGLRHAFPPGGSHARLGP